MSAKESISLSIDKLSANVHELKKQNKQKDIILDRIRDKMRTVSSQIGMITVRTLSI